MLEKTGCAISVCMHDSVYVPCKYSWHTMNQIDIACERKDWASMVICSVWMGTVV